MIAAVVALLLAAPPDGWPMFRHDARRTGHTSARGPRDGRVAWAFEARGYARIQLHTLPGNEPSARVAERAGFKREGLLRSFAMMKGGRTDIVMFSLLPGEL